MPETKKQWKTIIFDFDGVIADTDQGRFDVLSDILLEYRINLRENHSKEELQGISTDRFLKTSFPDLNRNQIAKIIQRRRSIFLSNLDRYCIPIRGSIDTIKQLRSSGYRLALATTNEKEIVKILLKYLKLNKMFSNVFGREDVEIDGSSLKNYKYVLKKIKEKTDNCLIIEDSAIGILSAVNTGVYCIAFGEKVNPGVKSPLITKIKNYSELKRLLC